jgi:predicted Zn-dependent peptidase
MEIDTFKVRGINIANIHNSSGIAFFGISTLAGSNYETPNEAGISHYIEHIGFKGTSTRNWKQINEEFARLGVNQNAFTSNTDVLYHSTCPKENSENVINLMLDMFFNSTFPIDEIEKERNVILEEKKMYDDDPKSAFSNAIGANMFSWNVGHETIGTYKTIKSLSRDQMLQYLKDKIDLDNFVFIFSGDIKSENLKRYIEANIPDKHPYLRKGNGLHTVDANGLWLPSVLKCKDKIKFTMERENITQSVIYMMMSALPANSPSYFAEAILYEGIGGGMYSRLYSRIREELGLCYSVGMFSMPMSYPEIRIGNLYGYTSPKNVDKFILESEKVLKDVMDNGLDKDIFECAKTDYLSSILRQTETSVGKAMYLSKKLLIYKNASIKETIKKIRAVKIEECNELAKQVLSVPYNWAVMNPKE